MIKNVMVVIQVILFLSGVLVLSLSGADGSYESLNWMSLFGMGMCLIALVLHLIVSFIDSLLERWK